MNISISHNIAEVKAEFDGIKDTSLPYAISQAMNDVLFDMRTTELPREISSVFDKPVAFTTSPNAWNLNKATKDNLTASIQMQPLQAQYMQYQIFGGVELPKGSSIPIPQGTQKAEHGGLKRNWKSVMQKAKTFNGVPKGHTNAPGGVWLRVGKQYQKKTKGSPGKHTGNIVLQYAFVKKEMYQKKWDFQKQGGDYFKANFDAKFRIRLQQQLDHKSS